MAQSDGCSLTVTVRGWKTLWCLSVNTWNDLRVPALSERRLVIGCCRLLQLRSPFSSSVANLSPHLRVINTGRENPI